MCNDAVEMRQKINNLKEEEKMKSYAIQANGKLKMNRIVLGVCMMIYKKFVLKLNIHRLFDLRAFVPSIHVRSDLLFAS